MYQKIRILRSTRLLIVSTVTKLIDFKKKVFKKISWLKLSISVFASQKALEKEQRLLMPRSWYIFFKDEFIIGTN